jgi:capsular exopolysaccharide synthesis family protein
LEDNGPWQRKCRSEERFVERTAEVNPLRQLWRAVWKRRLLVACFTAASLLVVIAGTRFVFPPTYEAATVVLVERERKPVRVREEQEAVAALEFDRKVFLQTQSELIKGLPLVELTVRRLKLDHYRPPATIKARLSAFVGRIVSKMLQGYEPDPMKRAVRAIQRATTVEAIKDTDLIRIRVRLGDPGLAASAANALANLYVREAVRRRGERTGGVLEFVRGQSKSVGDRLAREEEALRRLRQAMSLVSLEEGQRVLLNARAQARDSLEKARAQLKEAQARVGTLRRELERQPSATVSARVQSRSPVLELLQGRLADARVRLASRLQELGESHPEVKSLREELQQIERQLKAEQERVVSSETSAPNPVHQSVATQLAQSEAELSAATAGEKALSQILSAYDQAARDWPSKELAYERLRRAIEIDRDMHKRLVIEAQDAEIARAGELRNLDQSIRIVQRASAPTNPVRPKMLFMLVMAVAVGLILGSSLAVAHEGLSRIVYAEEDAKWYLGRPVLATISLGRSASRPLAEASDPYSGSAEQFRKLRGVVRALATGKTYLVAGPEGRERSSEVAACLAASLAQVPGERTLLIDADLRQNSQAELFGVSAGSGLSQLLSQAQRSDAASSGVLSASDWEQAVVLLSERLDILPAGQASADPAALLESRLFPQLLSWASERYDWVIVSAAAVNRFGDASAMAGKTGNAVLVLAAGGTSIEEAQAAASALEKAGARVVGVVLVEQR